MGAGRAWRAGLAVAMLVVVIQAVVVMVQVALADAAAVAVAPVMQLEMDMAVVAALVTSHDEGSAGVFGRHRMWCGGQQLCRRWQQWWRQLRGN